MLLSVNKKMKNIAKIISIRTISTHILGPLGFSRYKKLKFSSFFGVTMAIAGNLVVNTYAMLMTHKLQNTTQARSVYTKQGATF